MDTNKNELGACRERCSQLEKELAQTRDRNKALGESAPFGIFTCDCHGRVSVFNGQVCSLFQWSQRPDSPPSNVFEWPMFVETGISSALRRCLERGERIIQVFSCPDSSGELLELRFHISPVSNSGGKINSAIVFVEDFSLVTQAIDAVQESDDRYRMLFHSAPVAMIERDASKLKGYLEDLRGQGVTDFSRYFDRHPEEIVHCMNMIKTIDCNQAFRELFEAEDAQELDFASSHAPAGEFVGLARDVILMVAEGRMGKERERVLTTFKGKRITVLSKALPVSGHETTLSRLVVTLIDISKRKTAEEALRISESKFRGLALHDTLTGLYNRRYLYQTLPELIASGDYDRSGISLIFMDLDNFKKIVDTYGHLNGSQVIKEVADTIRRLLVSPAFAVAYAGDEFVVVLPGCRLNSAFDTAQRIQEQIRQTIYLAEAGFQVRLHASFGLAAYPDHTRDAEELLRLADRALFVMKDRGKDGINLYSLD